MHTNQFWLCWGWYSSCFYSSSVWLKYVCPWQDNVEEKEIGEKYPKNLIALNCHRHWTIKRSKVKIYLKYSSWIYAKVKKVEPCLAHMIKKKRTNIDNCCSKHAHDENVYKRYVMPLINLKWRQWIERKRKKLNISFQNIFFFFLSHEKYFTEINDNK